jgi:hypothetical protein
MSAATVSLARLGMILITLIAQRCTRSTPTSALTKYAGLASQPAALHEEQEAEAYKELAAEIRATPVQSPIGLAVFALLAWNEHSHLWWRPREELDKNDGPVRDLIEGVLEYAGVPLPKTTL